MATKKSTNTNNTYAPQAPTQEAAPTNTDHNQTTPTVEDTAAEASTPEPAASPTHQAAVDTPTAADKGDGTNQEAGDDPGPNMTSHDYDALHGLTSNVHDDSATGEQPPLALLTAERIGLTPRQHVTSIIAGGVISGILARTKPYEVLDLRKAAEAIGMCDTIVDMILHLDDPAPESPDEQPNS